MDCRLLGPTQRNLFTPKKVLRIKQAERWQLQCGLDGRGGSQQHTRKASAGLLQNCGQPARRHCAPHNAEATPCPGSHAPGTSALRLTCPQELRTELHCPEMLDLPTCRHVDVLQQL